MKLNILKTVTSVVLIATSIESFAGGGGGGGPCVIDVIERYYCADPQSVNYPDYVEITKEGSKALAGTRPEVAKECEQEPVYYRLSVSLHEGNINGAGYTGTFRHSQSSAGQIKAELTNSNLEVPNKFFRVYIQSLAFESAPGTGTSVRLSAKFGQLKDEYYNMKYNMPEFPNNYFNLVETNRAWTCVSSTR